MSLLLKSSLLWEPMTDQDPPVCVDEGHVMIGMWYICVHCPGCHVAQVRETLYACGQMLLCLMGHRVQIKVKKRVLAVP